MKKIVLTLVFLGIFTSNWAQNRKIIALNGAVTEIVCALGFQNEIIATDVTSTFPASLKVKDLGHVRSLSIESVLALKPTMILATSKDLSPDLIAKFKATGIKTHILEQEFSVAGTKKLIQEVAAILGAKNTNSLQNQIDKQLKLVKKIPNTPKVLFVYARGAGTLMVAGSNTPIDKMITLAGAKNAVSGFSDFKPLTPEALLNANPDYILFFDSGLQSLGGINGALKIDGILKTTAGKNKNILAMDGALLSGFGPRVGEAAVQLNQLIGNDK